MKATKTRRSRSAIVSRTVQQREHRYSSRTLEPFPSPVANHFTGVRPSPGACMKERGHSCPPVFPTTREADRNVRASSGASCIRPGPVQAGSGTGRMQWMHPFLTASGKTECHQRPRAAPPRRARRWPACDSTLRRPARFPPSPCLCRLGRPRACCRRE